MSEELTAAQIEENGKKVKRALPSLLVIFLFGLLMNSAFNLVYQNVGESLGIGETASLITTIPGIVLGVVCMLYGTLCDFISPRRMTIFGVAMLLAGSVLGFVFSGSFWVVLMARVAQSAGAKVAGSVFLVMAVKFLNDKERVFYIGIYGAVAYAAEAIGALAGGVIASYDWRFLILLPAISILFVPALIKNTPDISGKGGPIDVFGITLFGAIAAGIVIYFSYPSMWLIALTAALCVVFGIYVVKGKNPFIDKAFITNGSFLSVLALVFTVHLCMYAISPLFNMVGTELFGLPLYQVSMCVTITLVCSAITGTASGVIVNKLGRTVSMTTAFALLAIGFAGAAMFIGSGIVVFTVCLCLVSTGTAIAYTTLWECASDAVPKEENGRSVGICDLMMNTSGSIGLAVYSVLLAQPALSAGSLTGASAGIGAMASNVLLAFAAVAVITLALFAVFRRTTLSKERIGG